MLHNCSLESYRVVEYSQSSNQTDPSYSCQFICSYLVIVYCKYEQGKNHIEVNINLVWNKLTAANHTFRQSHLSIYKQASNHDVMMITMKQSTVDTDTKVDPDVQMKTSQTHRWDQ
jgi:hypothetical protein